ncbi:MAG: DUF2171 domain-containing protein [Chloroflexia bacterium]|nr:DUF2171 domain-containing protein [Chloroflexia bacterium]
MDVGQIQNGWDVYGSDGDKIGDVGNLGPNYVLVMKGFLFTKDIYIPTSAITGIEHDRVYLNIAKDQVDSMGWDQAQTDDTSSRMMADTTSGTTGTVETSTTPSRADDSTTATTATNDSTTVTSRDAATDTDYPSQQSDDSTTTTPRS